MAKTKTKEIIEKVLISPVFISLMVFLLAALVVYRLTITKVDSAYDRQFIRDVLVEAHGMLFDILIIGTFIFALHTLVGSRREKKRNIERWQEEIDDFRGWESDEAKVRILGNIKRLNRNGITEINLIGCLLKNANLSFTHLERARLLGAHLERARLLETHLEGANLRGAYLKGAFLVRAKLEGAKLEGANLEGAFLQEANLKGAIFLPIEQLFKVKTLHKAKLDPELEKEIKEKYPHLLEEPKYEE